MYTYTPITGRSVMIHLPGIFDNQTKCPVIESNGSFNNRTKCPVVKLFGLKTGHFFRLSITGQIMCSGIEFAPITGAPVSGA
jgi:hypothetical protein